MKVLTKDECKKIFDLAVNRTVEYLKQNSLKGVSLGISGGIDSAVVAVVGLKAIQKLNDQGYQAGYDYMFLDCDSDPFDYQRAQKLAKQFKFKLDYIDLGQWFKASPLLKLIPPDHSREKIAKGNIKCRLRMISIYHSASINGHIYLDTDDLSEELMGFWTKHGDEGDVKIIQHLTKTEVYDLAEYLGIPKIILQAPPGDGLKVTKGNLAEDQLGLPYLDIEYIMSRFIGSGFDYNGAFSQLKQRKFVRLIKSVSTEVKKPIASIEQVLKQALKTSFKRKYGDNICHLLPSRLEFGLPEVGTAEFNRLYLKAINSNC